MTITAAPRLAAFLAALPHLQPQEFVSPPGLGGTWRTKFIRSGLERGAIAVHWSGAGLCIVQPSSHAVCRECAISKSRSECTHCSCSMCVWLRQSDEHTGSPVSRERVMQLARQLQTFQMAQPTSMPMLDEDF